MALGTATFSSHMFDATVKHVDGPFGIEEATEEARLAVGSGWTVIPLFSARRVRTYPSAVLTIMKNCSFS